MKQFPLFHNLRDSRWLIVGGGIVASRRASAIAAAGAVFDIVALDCTDELTQLCKLSGGQVYHEAWKPVQLSESYSFVIAATNSAEINREIARECNHAGIPVNVSSDTSLSDFVFPTVIDRDPLLVAVSSGSASPILARLLGERINTLIPAGYGKLSGLVSSYRGRVRELIKVPSDRKKFWEKILLGSVAESVFSGDMKRANAELEDALERPGDGSGPGEVYLIGAGPGDPDLLTFRAFRLLQQAEVVLYDRLVSEKILQQVNADAEMIYVGKRRSHHSVPQVAINQQLLDYALSGKRVARLKGGDPFIFGRGGEEIELLASHGIRFQVVPGITAASGCASYAGIPLTHREHAQSVRFVTGQLQDGTVNLPWKDLVGESQTLVIYMGLNGLPIISSQLIEHGLAPDTPAAMVEQGTTLSQKVHVSTLAQLPDEMKNREVAPPTLLIIGSVVSLHEQLHWFNPPDAEGLTTPSIGV